MALAAVVLAGGCGGESSRLFVSPTGAISPAVRRQMELPTFSRKMVDFLIGLIPSGDEANGSLERPYRRIQDALDAVPEVKRSLFHDGREVVISLTPGDYSEHVTVRQGDVRIEGLFAQSTWIRAPIIEGDEVAMRVRDVRNVTISAIRFLEGATAVAIEDASLVTVSDCLFEGFRDAAVRATNTDGLKLLNNTIRKPAPSGAAKGLRADLRGSYIRVAGNRIYGVESAGVLLETGEAPGGDAGRPKAVEVLVEDNVIEGARSHALMIESPPADRLLRATVRGNRFAEPGGYGIGCGEGVAISVSDNVFEKPGLGDVMPFCIATTAPAPEPEGF